MFTLPVSNVMEKGKLIATNAATTVFDASELMAENKVGAVLVLEGDALIGIFTERDAVFRVIAKGLDASRTVLREVMTPSPRTIGPETPFGVALLIMHENGFRHVPIVENGKAIGIVSARNALDPALEEFGCEANRRKKLYAMACMA